MGDGRGFVRGSYSDRAAFRGNLASYDVPREAKDTDIQGSPCPPAEFLGRGRGRRCEMAVRLAPGMSCSRAVGRGVPFGISAYSNCRIHVSTSWQSPALETFLPATAPVTVSKSIHLDTAGNQGFASVRDVGRTRNVYILSYYPAFLRTVTFACQERTSFASFPPCRKAQP